VLTRIGIAAALTAGLGAPLGPATVSAGLAAAWARSAIASAEGVPEFGHVFLINGENTTIEDGFRLGGHLGNANAVTPMASMWRPRGARR
jgi:hypothetical protein